MRRTSLADLLVPLVVVAGLAYLALRRYYDDLPTLRYAVALPVAALAVLEIVAARRVRAAVLHVRGARPMTAVAIARCVALAKASALVAAGLIGAVGALLLWVVPDLRSVDAARDDTFVGAVWLAATVALLIAALTLERAAVDPGRDRRR